MRWGKAWDMADHHGENISSVGDRVPDRRERSDLPSARGVSSHARPATLSEDRLRLAPTNRVLVGRSTHQEPSHAMCHSDRYPPATRGKGATRGLDDDSEREPPQ